MDLSSWAAVRLIAVEEHFTAPGIKEATSTGDWATRTRALGERGLRLGTTVLDRLDDFGADRLAAMDAAGIDMQVLFQTSPASTCSLRLTRCHSRATPTTCFLTQFDVIPTGSPSEVFRSGRRRPGCDLASSRPQGRRGPRTPGSHQRMTTSLLRPSAARRCRPPSARALGRL